MPGAPGQVRFIGPQPASPPEHEACHARATPERGHTQRELRPPPLAAVCSCRCKPSTTFRSVRCRSTPTHPSRSCAARTTKRGTRALPNPPLASVGSRRLVRRPRRLERRHPPRRLRCSVLRRPSRRRAVAASSGGNAPWEKHALRGKRWARRPSGRLAQRPHRCLMRRQFTHMSPAGSWHKFLPSRRPPLVSYQRTP